MHSFWCQFQPVTKLQTQLSGLFDRIKGGFAEDTDDLHQFTDCSNAPTVAFFLPAFATLGRRHALILYMCFFFLWPFLIS